MGHRARLSAAGPGRVADQERVIEHYAAMARQREKSEADEAQKRGKGAAA